ncbi:hypothetical protein LAZ67_X002445, partial [Cordylochernes scorpioides]
MQRETATATKKEYPGEISRPTLTGMVKLPKLTMERFYGEISQWLNFWNAFDSSINRNEYLTKIDKFNYLKAYLGGTAAQTVEGFCLSEENYDKAVELLKKRFGKRERLIDVHMNNLLALKPLRVTKDVGAFRELYGRILVQIRSLESLGVVVESYGNLLCPLLLKLLPSDLKLELHREFTGAFSLGDLIEFLERQLIALESTFGTRDEITAGQPSNEHPQSQSPIVKYRRNERNPLPTAAGFFNASEADKEKVLDVEQGMDMRICDGSSLEIGMSEKPSVVGVTLMKGVDPASIKEDAEMVVSSEQMVKEPSKQIAVEESNKAQVVRERCAEDGEKAQVKKKSVVEVDESNRAEVEKESVEADKEKVLDVEQGMDSKNTEEVKLLYVKQGTDLRMAERPYAEQGNEPKGDGVQDSEDEPKGDGVKDSEAETKDNEVEDSGTAIEACESVSNSKAVAEGADQVEIADGEAESIDDIEERVVRIPASSKLMEAGQIGDAEFKVKGYYLPDRPVCGCDSRAAPVRPAKDGASYRGRNGFSLKRYMKRIHSLLRRIPEIRIKLRRNKFGVVADLKRYFQMIAIRDNDWDYLKFLWKKKDGQLMVPEIAMEDNWATFVMNRVMEIRSLSETEDWCRVPGCLNPADLPSRGCLADSLERSKWWEGPSWLRRPRRDWPHREIYPDPDIVNSEKRKIVLTSTCIKRAELMLVRVIQRESFTGPEDKRLKDFKLCCDSLELLRVKTKISRRQDLERLIGLLKQLLRKILGQARLEFEELYTIICDTESLMNSRPLTSALFLHDFKEIGVPDLDSIERASLQKRYRFRQRLREDLWKRFRTEYFGFLRQETRRRSKTRPIKVGDLVLIGHDNAKRVNWPLARVVEVYPGRDGPVRVAKLRTSKGVQIRPVQRLYNLEIPADLGSTLRSIQSEPRRGGSRGEATSELLNSVHKSNGCVFCGKDNHGSPKCDFAANMSLNEKRSLMRKEGVCYKCLRPSHLSKFCRNVVRCSICNMSSHLDVMCTKWILDRGGSSKSPMVQDETLANLSTSPDVLLPTLRVTLKGNRTEKTARAIIDTGSQRSYILHSTAMEMEYEQSRREFFRHSLFGGSSTDVVEHEVYTIHLYDINNSYRWADFAGRLLTNAQRRISSGLVAIRTKLGWTVMGKIPPTEVRDDTSSLCVTTLLSLDLENLWKLAAIGVSDAEVEKKTQSLQAEMEEHFAHTTTRDIEERYEVALPWVQDKEMIPTNRDLAENQLSSVRRKLEEVGDMKEPVFNASARKKDKLSLNDCLDKGPNLIEIIPRLLNKFRKYEVGVSSDIEKAFLQIGIKEEDRDAAVFEIAGVDLTGHLILNNKKRAWIVIFTCVVYRGVHLELVTSLPMEAFLQAFHRFIARRGCPLIVYSDNGTNFRGMVNTLKKIDFSRLKCDPTLKNITSKFIPSGAPWWDGWWERLIGMMKQLLFRILGQTSLGYEELSTVMCDVESLMNSCPLTYLTEESEDLVPLTPSLFLHEVREVGVPDLNLIDNQTLSRKYQYIKRVREYLRERFRIEYFGFLRQETRRLKTTIPFK